MAEPSPPDSAETGAVRGRPTPLFDLSGIDLGGTAISAEELAKYIPHAGHMRQIDRVIWRSEDWTRALAVKQVRGDEFWCAGHIPGRPILPGVLMVEAGAQVASVSYYARVNHRRFAGFTRIENTVFRGMVVPGDELLLLAREVKFHPKRFISDLQGIVRDRIVFESRITGMILSDT